MPRQPAMLLRLDDETQALIREMAKAEGASLSAFVAALAHAEAARRNHHRKPKGGEDS